MSNQTNERRSLKQPLILLLILSVVTITLMFVVPFEYRKIPMFIGLILMMPLALKANEIKEHNKKVRKLNQETIATKASADTNVHQNTKKDDLAVKDPSVYEKSSALNLTHEEYTRDEETYKQFLNEKVAKVIGQTYNFLPPDYDKFLIYYTRNLNGELVGEIGLKMHKDDENYVPLEVLTQMYEVDLNKLKPEIEVMEQDISDIINPDAKPPIGESIKALVVEHAYEGKSNCNFIYYDIRDKSDISVHEQYLFALKEHTNHQAFPNNFDDTYNKIHDYIKMDYERRKKTEQ